MKRENYKKTTRHPLQGLFEMVIASKEQQIIVKSLLWPLSILTIHISLSAFLLWFVPEMNFMGTLW